MKQYLIPLLNFHVFRQFPKDFVKCIISGYENKKKFYSYEYIMIIFLITERFTSKGQEKLIQSNLLKNIPSFKILKINFVVIYFLLFSELNISKTNLLCSSNYLNIT